MQWTKTLVGGISTYQAITVVDGRTILMIRAYDWGFIADVDVTDAGYNFDAQ